jgi:hypothetical protein
VASLRRDGSFSGPALAVLAGAAFCLVALVALADPPAAKKPPAPKPAAAASAAPAASAEPAVPAGGYAPDPAGVASRKQWLFDVSVRGGKARVVRADAVALDHAVTTARVLGRFAIELYIGKELLDRIRFNVPLTGDDRDPAGDPKLQRRRRPFSQPTFDDVTTRLKVQIADNPRATYVQLVDRATGDKQRFAWPPDSDGRLTPYNAKPTPPASASPVSPPTTSAPRSP